MDSESERTAAGAPASAASAGTDAEATASPPAKSSDKGLKKGAIGFMDGLAIGLDSTAPAYSRKLEVDIHVGWLFPRSSNICERQQPELVLLWKKLFEAKWPSLGALPTR